MDNDIIVKKDDIISHKGNKQLINNRIAILLKFSKAAKIYSDGYSEDLTEGLKHLTQRVYNKHFKEDPFRFKYDYNNKIVSLRLSKEISQDSAIELTAKIIWEIISSDKFFPHNFSTLKKVLSKYITILDINEFFEDILNEKLEDSISMAYVYLDMDRELVGS